MRIPGTLTRCVSLAPRNTCVGLKRGMCTPVGRQGEHGLTVSNKSFLIIIIRKGNGVYSTEHQLNAIKVELTARLRDVGREVVPHVMRVRRRKSGWSRGRHKQSVRKTSCKKTSAVHASALIQRIPFPCQAHALPVIRCMLSPFSACSSRSVHALPRHQCMALPRSSACIIATCSVHAVLR
uniref:Uncharacterized protein n=1 Tax=Knipowitschia caucasica TaxID=637954 RepID=A0AAV2J498_KNICA